MARAKTGLRSPQVFRRVPQIDTLPVYTDSFHPEVRCILSHLKDLHRRLHARYIPHFPRRVLAKRLRCKLLAGLLAVDFDTSLMTFLTCSLAIGMIMIGPCR